MVHAYSREQVNTFADENYRVLRSYCAILDQEGYWEAPKNVLRHSIYSILDMYVQTVLIKLMQDAGGDHPEVREFIGKLPDINIFGIDSENELSAKSASETDRLFNSPPILLQLCGLRDYNCGSGLTGLFFDALFNIQISMSFYYDSNLSVISRFIKDYYGRIEAFLQSGDKYGNMITERYIFMKLCNGVLENSASNLIESGTDFNYYRKHFLFFAVPEEKKTSNDHEPYSHVIKEAVPDREERAIQRVLASENNEKTEEKKICALPEVKGELDRLLMDLNSLVGLTDVKEEVGSLINLIKVRKLREKHGLPLMDMSFHMVFTGNPGTGKTTVARLVAGIYKELGLLSKGQLVETDRSGLVAGYVGQTALKVREVVEKALGGVLFIDEAYALSHASGTNDFGDEAIETLVKMMEDYRDDLVVIVAGYTDEMNSFLKSNTGLTSRFNRFIGFKDYTDEELLDIMKTMADKAGFRMSKQAEKAVSEIISEMDESSRREFGNARGIRNLFEKIVVNQANRVVLIESPDVDSLTLIEGCDVR